jgi:hypothetical protein
MISGHPIKDLALEQLFLNNVKDLVKIYIAKGAHSERSTKKMLG